MMVNRSQLIEVVLILLNEGLFHTFTNDLVHEETIHLLISDLDRLRLRPYWKQSPSSLVVCKEELEI